MRSAAVIGENFEFLRSKGVRFGMNFLIDSALGIAKNMQFLKEIAVLVDTLDKLMSLP